MTEQAVAVLRLIGDGRWRLLDAIAATLGMDRRTVEGAIEELRLAGHPVVGGGSGVKLSDNPLEVREYAQQRRHRALAIARGTRSLLHAANRLEGRDAGQRTLWRDVA